MKLQSLIPKLTKHVIQYEIEDSSDTIWWKYAYAQRKINVSTSFTIDNMHYVNFRIQEQESVPWCGKFQNEDYNHLGTLLIFTLIPLMPKMCGLSISCMKCSMEN